MKDPWVRGGVAILAILSVLSVMLYRSAPASFGEARARVLSSALPSSFGPQLSQARERLAAGRSEAEAGRDSTALLAFEEAVRAAGAAWELAGDPRQAETAIAVWAEANVESAEMLLRMGTGAGLRPDDDEVLEAALARVREVVAAPVDSAGQERAMELQRRIQRQLRTGPLEWLPPWRS